MIHQGEDVPGHVVVHAHKGRTPLPRPRIGCRRPSSPCRRTSGAAGASLIRWRAGRRGFRSREQGILDLNWAIKEPLSMPLTHRCEAPYRQSRPAVFDLY
jgi:hypothetical protein